MVGVKRMEERAAGTVAERGDLNWEAAFRVNFFGCLTVIGVSGGKTVRLVDRFVRDSSFSDGIESSIDLGSAASELFPEETVFFMSGERNGVASFLCCNFCDAKVGRFCVGRGETALVFESFLAKYAG
jgi:hypothetical protein